MDEDSSAAPSQPDADAKTENEKAGDDSETAPAASDADNVSPADGDAAKNAADANSMPRSQSQLRPKDIEKLSEQQIRAILPEDKLDVDVCLQSLAKHRQTRWYEVR